VISETVSDRVLVSLLAAVMAGVALGFGWAVIDVLRLYRRPPRLRVRDPRGPRRSHP
jgi:hypothetical protein